MDKPLERTQKHLRILDEIMAEKWIILNRAPSFSPTCLLAFHPVRIHEKVIRIHLFACPLLNADFDGDQLAVILPVTEAGQKEASEKLSIKGHLNRDPDLFRLLCPRHEAMLGIMRLSITDTGRKKILAITDEPILNQHDFLNTYDLEEALLRVARKQGTIAGLEIADKLMALGFEETTSAGISHPPFGIQIENDMEPPAEFTELFCGKYHDKLEDCLVALKNNLESCLIKHQIMSVISGARGQTDWLVKAYHSQIFQDISGNWQVHHGALSSGLSAEVYTARAAASRIDLGNIVLKYERMAEELWQNAAPIGVNVMARAARSGCPGTVFARAAAIGEIDPLTDPDSRLFLGLKPL